MTGDVDPLAVDEGVPRDWLHRPLIIPAPRGKPNLKAKLETYTRASTFAKTLSDGGQGLTTWQIRHATLGIALRPDLAAMAAALGRNLNDYTPEDKRNLDAIVASAHDTSGGNDKANWGTAVHSLTEDPLGEERERGYVDGFMSADVEAYDKAIDGVLEAVSSEQFVVNDELKVAGTYDHAYRLVDDLTWGQGLTLPAGTILSGDKKTGTMHWVEVSIQLAIYARGKGYDHTTGERTSLDMSPQWGVVAHIPKGKGEAVLYLVDLHAGWELAKIASKARSVKPSSLRVKFAEAKTPKVVDGAPAESTTAMPLADLKPYLDAIASSSAELVAEYERPYVEAVAAKQAQIAPAIAEAVKAAQEFAKPVAESAKIAARVLGQPAPEAEPTPTSETTPTVPTPTPSVDDDVADGSQDPIDLVKDVLGATEIVDPILTAIEAASNKDDVTALWRATVKADKSAWLDAHTDAAKARLAELKAA